MMLRRRWILVLLALALCPAAGRAAGRETRAYRDAVLDFNETVWPRAEEKFAEFVTNYPKSDRIPEAVLRQAQAQYQQADQFLRQQEFARARQKSAQAIDLLTAQQPKAGKLADEYLYWIGEAQFQCTNYPAAADAFGRLEREFPKSARRLAATVGEAAARLKRGDWARVEELLRSPDGAFQSALRSSSTNEWVVSGCLSLAEAELAQKNHAAAEAALQPLDRFHPNPEQDWQRAYVLCRIELDSDRAADSLACSSNLLALARASGRADLRAQSIAFQAGVLEKLDRRDEALAVWARNLTNNVPWERQREAQLKVAALAPALGHFPEAIGTLKLFLAQTPPPATADTALLALGELYLKQYIATAGTPAAATLTTNSSADTNLLTQALDAFDRLINAFPESALHGKAELDRGWCFWHQGKIAESRDAFRAATDRLPPSEDLAEARFKLGDALFLQKDYAGALQNYLAASDELVRWPTLRDRLGDQVLYQALRASLELRDMPAAANAVEQLLERNPASPLADRSLLLLGQGCAEPKAGRAWLDRLVQRSPDSPLRPEAELAIAHTYERDLDWPGAKTHYDAWLGRFATNALRPQAEFYRALAIFHSGDETNALAALTNFVAQFSTNELAPQAQLWVGDYYCAQHDYVSAERSYRSLIQTWPDSELAPEACMRAGRAAALGQNYPVAIGYFTNLTSRLDCPPQLKAQALFAYADALVLDSKETNRQPNLELAVKVLGQICLLYPTNEQCALARGEIGNCYLQLAALDPRDYDYAAASNSFQQVVTSAYAPVAARSGAQVGIAQVLEIQAQQASGDERVRLLRLALDNDLDVFHERNLRSEEVCDLWWVKEAGLDAARVAESLGEWTQAVKFYQRLEELLPQMKESLEKKIDRARGKLEPEK